MFTAQEQAIIKATVPLLETQGEALTKHFYTIMLTEYDEVRPFFNPAAQDNGRQPRALANSLLMYAKNIDALENLNELIATVIHKHASLQITPEQYPIVGSCLLRAIREVLGEEIATDEVISAWEHAYTALANILIQKEEDLYQKAEEAEGGWRGERLFVVANKVKESDVITSFYLKPVDGKPIIKHKPGQFLGLRCTFLENEQRRNYSISEKANGEYYRISVKREDGGVVSNYLHDHINIGDEIPVFPPFGSFVLQEGIRPIAFISGGIGITPMITMLEEALAADRKVTFIHAAQNHDVDPFYDWLYEQVEKHDHLTVFKCYDDNLSNKADHEGRLNTELLDKLLPVRDIDVYYLGPTPFMAAVKRSLVELNIPEEQSYYEFFGPAEALH